VNQAYKKLRVLVTILTEGEAGIDQVIADALARAGTPVSKSKLQGWRVATHFRNYRPMDVNDLERVLDALILYFKEDER
jgi:muconolactone delta-isomerase